MHTDPVFYMLDVILLEKLMIITVTLKFPAHKLQEAVQETVMHQQTTLVLQIYITSQILQILIQSIQVTHGLVQ